MGFQPTTPRWDPTPTVSEPGAEQHPPVRSAQGEDVAAQPSGGAQGASQRCITPAQRLAEEEAEILRTINEKKALMSAKEISKDVQYTQSIETGWKPPRTFAR